MIRKLVFVAFALALLAVPGIAGAAHPLLTAIAEHREFAGSDANANLALRRIRAAGATAFRVDLNWYQVVPQKRPQTFNPADPNDPAYDWSKFDRKLALLRANGLEPIAVINNPPDWAKSDSTPADVTQFGQFVRAAALRYGSGLDGLPRVRYWQIWIEPNVNKFFSPQTSGGRDVAPIIYRRLVNAAADALHGASADNLVVAGGLSPFTVSTGETKTIGPLAFMRELLCMSKGKTPKPTCADRTKFDVWAHHPYTSGGPTHHANLPDDVSLGDLPEMHRLLQAAVKAHHVVSSRQVQFWVTEFSWDTSPPDRDALPVLLQARWTSEALYRMWQDGITLVAWLQLRDDPYPSSPVQSGLYYRGATLQADRPKPTLAGFRFPFVAYGQRGGKVLVWGRTPGGEPANVVVERQTSSGWRRLLSLRTNRYGIFTRRLSTRPTTRGFLRGRIVAGAGVASRPFSLQQPPDRFVHPFG